MPRYELMYILASSVSDDQIPETTAQIEQYVTDFGGTDISHTQLGKKKLAYPIKKTRNGHYGVLEFSMEATKVNALDAKIRTQGNIIIRYLIANLDEHLVRMEKDRDAQAKMNRNRPVSQIPDEEKAAAAEQAANATPLAAKPAPEIVAEEAAPVATPAPAKETAVDLDQEIEKALSEDITK
ncbi:MAG: 30S ribosomal protein S6 [bacterium]|nr:30S ribosomal protein S6 [bacterium]